MSAGLPLGQHISLRLFDAAGKEVSRSYTPVSGTHQVGFVDFVIKVSHMHATYFHNCYWGDSFDSRRCYATSPQPFEESSRTVPLLSTASMDDKCRFVDIPDR